MTLRLHVYPPSVYCQIARMTLAECGVQAELVPCDPFSGTVPEHPFNRVPVLDHDGIRIFETTAILRYLDSRFAGGRLTPAEPLAAARMVQVQAVVDCYGYWPMVRQVFVHGANHSGDADRADLAEGLGGAARVLDVLERIAAEGRVLTGAGITLADCHLAPMIGFLARAPDGAALLAARPMLSAWFSRVRTRDSYHLTDPNRVMKG
ncbi:glutathione S-transferase family protein [Chachezhania sediminis]|uniref:glutathione S-transferase family protein n=1 Tax=Chachezhania sediminis TaxID=2599291 RepID=UPI00131CB6A0|nr:glutathione S-transferase family protein [Chachezhania sediminis]